MPRYGVTGVRAKSYKKRRKRERGDPMVVNIHVVHNERRTRSSLKPFAAAEKKRKKYLKGKRFFFSFSKEKNDSRHASREFVCVPAEIGAN